MWGRDDQVGGPRGWGDLISGGSVGLGYCKFVLVVKCLSTTAGSAYSAILPLIPRQQILSPASLHGTPNTSKILLSHLPSTSTPSFNFFPLLPLFTSLQSPL